MSSRTTEIASTIISGCRARRAVSSLSGASCTDHRSVLPGWADSPSAMDCNSASASSTPTPGRNRAIPNRCLDCGGNPANEDEEDQQPIGLVK